MFRSSPYVGSIFRGNAHSCLLFWYNPLYASQNLLMIEIDYR